MTSIGTAYGGMNPYVSTVAPGIRTSQTMVQQPMYGQQPIYGQPQQFIGAPQQRFSQPAQPVYQSVVQTPVYQPQQMIQSPVYQPVQSVVGAPVVAGPVRPVPVTTSKVVNQSKLAAKSVLRPPFPSAIPNEPAPIGTRKMAYNGYGTLPPVGSGIMSTPEELAMAQFGGQSTFNNVWTSQAPIVQQPLVQSTIIREAPVVRTVTQAPVVRTSVRAVAPPPVVVQQPPVLEQTVTTQIIQPPPIPIAKRNSVGATTLGGGNPYGLAAVNRGSSGYNAINNAASKTYGRLDPKTSLTAVNLGDIDGFTANQAPAWEPMNRPVNPAGLQQSYAQPVYPGQPVYGPGANPRGYNSVSSFVAGQGLAPRPY